MKRNLIAVAAAALAALGCASRDGSVRASAAAQGPRVTVINRAATTITGQPLRMPSEPWETVITIAELPPGGALPMHKHPWPRYAYVERGRLSVRYEAAGITREFGPGEAVVEAIDEWHEARVVGPEPVRLVLFDQVPRGASNVVPR